MQKLLIAAAALAALTSLPLQAADDETVLNIYSARGEATSEDLYNDFMESSKLRVNRSENDAETTLQRLADEDPKDKDDEEQAEARPDVVLLDGVAHLDAAAQQELLQPVQSKQLDEAVPKALRASADDDGGTPWFGLSRRARVIVYDPDQVDADDIKTYEQLADSKHKGKLCMAPATSAANLGLLAAMIAHDGKDDTQAWLKGVTDNLARDAGGTDAEQIQAVAAGECEITLANHYEWTRLLRSDESADRDVARSVAVAFPNQDSWGTHVDVAGGAVARHAPHAKQAVQFLEYVVSEPGQNLFANSNDEWPVLADDPFDNAQLQALLGEQDDFTADDTPLADIASHLDEARKLAAGDGAGGDD